MVGARSSVWTLPGRRPHHRAVEGQWCDVDEPDRRLAAIVCADIAGYSCLMGADEEGTFARLQAVLDEIVHPAAEAQRGRVVKTMGDGFLAEFASAVRAVRFALDVQRRCAEAGGALRFRVGVHLGDVIVRGGDVFGEG